MSLASTQTENEATKPRAEGSASKLHVRLAKSLSDLDFTRPVSVELHEESRFSNIPYSHEKRDRLFMRAIKDPDHYGLFIAQHGQEPVGFLFCTIGEYIVGGDHLLTTVFSFYVRKRYRHSALGGKAALRILRGLSKWSRVRKAKEIMIHVTAGIEIQRVDRLMRRTGFDVIGANYSLALNYDENR